MKRVIKASKELTEDQKKAWLNSASAKDLLNQYDSLHADTIRGFSYNPDFELTRTEVLKRLGSNVQEEPEIPEPTLAEVIDNMIYQIWDNNKGEELTPPEVVDEVIEHIEMLNNENELDVYLPDDWRKQVGNAVTEHYDEYEW